MKRTSIASSDVIGQDHQTRSDGLYKWLVFISAYVIVVVDVGIFYTMGKLFVTIKDTFNSSRAEAALVQSTALGVGLGSGIINGAIIHKFGPRNAGLFGAFLCFTGLSISFIATSVTYLVLSLGICMAMGISILFISTSTVVGTYFAGKSNLMALSVLSTGSGVGGIAYPYLIGYLSDMYGVRGTLLIMGGIVLNSAASALLWQLPVTNSEKNKQNNDLKTISQNINDNNLKHETKTVISTFTEDSYSHSVNRFKEIKDVKEVRPSVLMGSVGSENNIQSATPPARSILIKQSSTDKGTQRTMWQSFKFLMKNKAFVAFAIGMGLVYPAFGIFLIFIVDIFIDKGYSESDSSLGILLINIFSIIGRVLPGFLIQMPCVSTLYIPILSSLIGLVGMVTILVVPSLELIYVVCSVVGLGLGINVTAFVVTTVQLVGKENVSAAVGVVFTINGIGNAVVGPISGLLRDETGSYVVVFVSGGTAMLLGCITFFIAHCVSQNIKKHRKRKTSVFYSTKL